MTLILVVCCNLIFLQNASFDAGSRHNGIMQNNNCNIDADSLLA